MIIKSHFSKILLAGCATAALSACGADDVASPGSGGSITINNPTPAPSPTPSPTPTPSTVTAAADCPTVEVALTNSGTITGPTGTYRVCTLPAKIDTDTTLPQIDGLLYELAGRVDVGDDLGATATAGEASVTLTIRPGAILYGKAVSWLAVNRGNKLMAVGEAAKPMILPYRQKMTALDVMIAVGGMTEFADGNKASILRTGEGNKQYSVRLSDLLKRGDVSANVEMRPGDVLIIPQSWF